MNGVHVVGKVKERDEAFATSDDAMSEGHGAFLIDEERPDVFQASVGNLPPGKEVLLKVTYVTELDGCGRGAAVRDPDDGVAAIRAGAEDRAGVGRPDAKTLNPPVAWARTVLLRPDRARHDDRSHWKVD